jgi:hypothetical protein
MQHKIHRRLVSSLGDFMRAIASGGPLLRPPGHGRYTYQEIVAQYVKCIRYFAYQSDVSPSKGFHCFCADQQHEEMSLRLSIVGPFLQSVQDYYPCDLTEELWDLLVLHPVDPEDFNHGIRFILTVSEWAENSRDGWLRT